ncbi:MAG: hypothetical protein CMK92_00780, partial [Pseudomonas sp.]|nr:hypothetical protein [Pseudomonas sp.]
MIQYFACMMTECGHRRILYPQDMKYTTKYVRAAVVGTCSEWCMQQSDATLVELKEDYDHLLPRMARIAGSLDQFKEANQRCFILELSRNENSTPYILELRNHCNLHRCSGFLVISRPDCPPELHLIKGTRRYSRTELTPRVITAYKCP